MGMSTIKNVVNPSPKVGKQRYPLIWHMPKTHFRFMIHYCLQAGSFAKTGLHCGSAFAPLRHEPEHVAEVS